MYLYSPYKPEATQLHVAIYMLVQTCIKVLNFIAIYLALESSYIFARWLLGSIVIPTRHFKGI